ncbi:MAG: hypothetical protein OEM52_10005 [bacterium]|nr:hypothetical protein [bacterium]
MRRTTAALLFILCLAGGAFAARWQVIEPEAKAKGGLPVTTNGKLLRYSPATATSPLVVEVNGPTVIRAKVRVATRTALRSFKVMASLDNGTPVEFPQDAMESNSMEGPNGMKLSMAQDIDFKIPDGPHTIKFSPSIGDTTTLFFRVYNRILDTGEPAEWEAIAPRGFRDLVGVVVREREATYYRQTNERPLEFKLNGPMRVRVLTRAEVAGGKMDRSIKWRLEVKLDGQSIGVYPCDEVISSIAGHSIQSEYVLTSAAVINFDLPQGKHNVTVHLLDSDINVVNRILIPAKALTNTGK